MANGVGDLFGAVEPREHHTGGTQIKHSPGANPLRALDPNDDRYLMDSRRQDLPDQRVLAPAAVFEVDDEPIEARESTRFGGEYRSEVDEGAESGFV